MLVAALAALTAVVAPAVAQENGGHEGHDMSAMAEENGGHGGHDMAAMMSVGEGGSWSYTERENPKMRMHGRWELVPTAGRAGTAVSAAGMTRQARCAALMASTNLMHDHATLAACTGASQPAMAEKQNEMRQNRDMDHGDGGHDH